MTTRTLPNWHPWRDNPLDFIGATLVTPDNKPVTLTRENMEFVVRIDGKEVSRSRDNSSTCGVLYHYEVMQEKA